MVGRQRGQTFGFSKGGIQEATGYGLGWFTSDTSPNCIQRIESMYDYTSQHPYPDNPLTYYRSEILIPVTVNGQQKVPMPSGWLFRYKNWRPLNFNSPDQYYLPLPTMDVSWAYLVTKAMANANPSTPVIDIPLFLFEFKDFPGMIKNAGDILSGVRNISRGINPKKVNDGFLAYQYGWAPWFSDLNKLLGIAESIEKRRKYILSHRGGGSVHRRLGGSSKTPAQPHTNGVQATLTELAEWTTTYTETWEYWYSCKLNVNMSIPSLAQSGIIAARAALGLNLSAATIWNAIPWSFLIDYFSNIGDFLNATRGYVPANITQMCVMAKGTLDRYSVPGKEVNGFHCSLGHARSTFKGRHVESIPTPHFTLAPFLTGKQIANVTSLSMARILR